MKQPYAVGRKVWLASPHPIQGRPAIYERVVVALTPSGYVVGLKTSIPRRRDADLEAFEHVDQFPHDQVFPTAHAARLQCVANCLAEVRKWSELANRYQTPESTEDDS